jgi:hypothetical protein
LAKRPRFALRKRARGESAQCEPTRRGLGYPDGTIHPLAEQWIAMKVQSMIQARATPKSKRKT